jgi:putative ABC transport system permease protein
MTQKLISSIRFLSFACLYAMRNLSRNRRRTFLTLSIVIIASGVTLLCHRYSVAVMKLWADGAADTGTGHAQVHKKGYWEKQEGVDIDLTISEDNDLEKQLKTDPKVEIFARRLELEGIVSNGENSIYFLGKGVQPEAEAALSPRLFKTDDEGQWLRTGHPNEVVVGFGLAHTLGLKLGDEITLITQTVQGSVNGIDAKVVGFVNASIPSFSQRIIYAPIELLQKLIRMPGNYTELAVRLRPETKIDQWIKDVKNKVENENLQIRPWSVIEPVINNVGKIWNSVVLVIACLLFSSAALTVLNIVYMIVAERTVEIGTLMAIGSKPRHIKLIFALEASILGITGGLLGALVGNSLVFTMGYFGIPFKNPFGNGELSINPQMDILTTALITGFAIIVCMMAAWAPSRKASEVDPVKAFRGQMT